MENAIVGARINVGRLLIRKGIHVPGRVGLPTHYGAGDRLP